MGTFVNPNFNQDGMEATADVSNFIQYLDNERQLTDKRLSLMGKELMILEAIMKEQMTDSQYAETRKRIEAELFPPPPNIDQAAVDRIKEDMESMQKDANDFRDETQGMLKDLSSVMSEMSGFIKEMRDRVNYPAPVYPPEDDLDRGTTDEVQPPDDWICPECGKLMPESESDTHECSRPPYVCPNCNEEVPHEQKNEHKCAKPVPKKPRKK